MNGVLNKRCHILLLKLVVCGSLAAAPAMAAEPLQPVVEGWTTSWNEWVLDGEFLGSLVQNPSLGKALGRALAARSGVASLDGLDPQRPIGAILGTDGLRLAPMLLVPVDDVQALLTSLAPLLGPAQPQPNNQNLWKIGRRAVTGYVLADDGWAYVAQTPDLFDQRPTTAAIRAAIAQRGAGQDLVVTFHPRRLPEALRTMAIDLLREQATASMRRTDESDEQFAARQRVSQAAYAAVEQWFTDYEQATWTWSLDRQSQQGRLTVEAVALPESRLAKLLAGIRVLNRPGLPARNEAALAIDVACRMEPELAERLRLLLADVTRLARGSRTLEAMEDQKPEVADSSSAGLLDLLLTGHPKDGTVDLSLRVEGMTPPLTVLGRFQDGGRAIERILNRADNQVQGGGWQVQRNVAIRGGQAVHAIRCDCRDEKRLTRLFGPDHRAYVAVLDRASMLAIGNDAVEKLGGAEKPASDAAAEQTAALDVSLRLGALSMVADTLFADPGPAMALSVLSANLRAGDDRVVLRIEPDDRRLRTSLMVHSGVLRAGALGLNIVALQTLSRPPATPRRDQ